MRRVLTGLFVFVGLFTTTLSAEEKQDAKLKFGLTFPELGAIWHVNDHMAFMPFVSFGYISQTTKSSFTSSSYNQETTTKSSQNTIGAGVAVRFYFKDWNGLRFYLSPRYRYSSMLYGTDTNDARYHNASGGWGFQYNIGSRVGLYGDIGASYTYHTFLSSTKTDTSTSTTNIHSHQIGTNVNWGVILYLK